MMEDGVQSLVMLFNSKKYRLWLLPCFLNPLQQVSEYIEDDVPNPSTWRPGNLVGGLSQMVSGYTQQISSKLSKSFNDNIVSQIGREFINLFT
jgi:hypothetical protein